MCVCVCVCVCVCAEMAENKEQVACCVWLPVVGAPHEGSGGPFRHRCGLLLCLPAMAASPEPDHLHAMVRTGRHPSADLGGPD